MPGFERAATIDRSPTQVYAVLDDVQGARAWMPAIRKVEVLTPGFAVDVGYRWRETRRVLGIFRMSAEMEVVEHDAPRRWAARFEDKRMRMTATFDLQPSGEGTLVRLREELEDLRGDQKRAASTAQWMEKSDGDLLQRLKAHVESQPRQPDPQAPRFAPTEAVHAPAAPSIDGDLPAGRAAKARRKAPAAPRAKRATGKGPKPAAKRATGKGPKRPAKRATKRAGGKGSRRPATAPRSAAEPPQGQ